MTGEPFETDYLPDSNYIHLFAPTTSRAPRLSAGCVKLIEPTEDGYRDAVFDIINSSMSLASHIVNGRGL